MKKYSEMLSGFGISHFHYIKVFNNGNYIHLLDNENFANYYINKVHDVDLFFSEGYQDGYNSLLWSSNVTSRLFLEARRYDIANGFTLSKFHENYFEAWSFSGKCQDINLSNCYIKYIDELKKFSTFFKKSESSLIQGGISAVAKFKKYSFNHQNAFLSLKKNLNYRFPIFFNGLEVKLTVREEECLKLISNGLTFKGIGKKLNISSRTVETYINNLKYKLNKNPKSDLASIYNDYQWR
tara:strand:- start:412 stop:1128 length:717 start_codon:yes stop_codon:yes gene_type:complete